MTTYYDIDIKGNTDSMVRFLTDLLERDATPINTYENLRIKDLSWVTPSDTDSRVFGRLSIESNALKKSDLDLIRNDYKVTFNTKKVASDD